MQFQDGADDTVLRVPARGFDKHLALDSVRAVAVAGYSHLQEPLNVEMAHDVQPRAPRRRTGPEVPQWHTSDADALMHRGLVHACNEGTVAIEALNSLAMQEQSAWKGLKRYRALLEAGSGHDGQTSDTVMTWEDTDARAEAECRTQQLQQTEMSGTEIEATAEAECRTQQLQEAAASGSGQPGTPALHQSTSTLHPRPSGLIRGSSGAIRSWHEVMMSLATLPELPCSALQDSQQQATLLPPEAELSDQQRSVLGTANYDKVGSCLLLPEGWHFNSQGGELQSNVPTSNNGLCTAILQWMAADKLMDHNNQPKDLLRLW
eukprot:jgi/Chrzof1/6505/Cz18g13230.t1